MAKSGRYWLTLIIDSLLLSWFMIVCYFYISCQIHLVLWDKGRPMPTVNIFNCSTAQCWLDKQLGCPAPLEQDPTKSLWDAHHCGWWYVLPLPGKYQNFWSRSGAIVLGVLLQGFWTWVTQHIRCVLHCTLASYEYKPSRLRALHFELLYQVFKPLMIAILYLSSLLTLLKIFQSCRLFLRKCCDHILCMQGDALSSFKLMVIEIKIHLAVFLCLLSW